MPIYFGDKLVNNVLLGNTTIRNIAQNPEYTIGQYAFGGVIVYVTGSFPNQTGIVAALNDAYTASSFPYEIWGCSGTNITTSTGIFTGQANTNAILAGCVTRPIFASIADSYSSSGYTDWYLPSQDELDAISTNYTVVPNLSMIARYVTSTQVNSTTFRARYINDIVANTNKSDNSIVCNVRCVRTF
jgi:hypothetical protein